MAKIGIFGGSFNPPHLGHMLAAREFQRKLGLDLVLLVPSAQPPHKQLTSNSPDVRARLKMTCLMAQELPFTQVSDLECRRTGASYTADTVAQLRALYPNDELFLLMGTDMFYSFDNWYRPEDIAREVNLVVANRSQEEKQRLLDHAEVLHQKYCAQSQLLENDFLPYSSTTVRTMIAFDCAQEYLSDAVAQYIREQKLYYSGADLKELPFEKLSNVSLSLHLPKRVPHVVGCSQTAVELARRYGENETDAKRAGILHDITKLLSGTEQLKLCEKYAIMISNLERQTPKLLHAKTGAAVAKYIFGENEAVCQSIFWHTTGRAEMTTLEKIIYLADYVEPNRDFSGVETLRRLAAEDLDAAMCLGLQMTLQQLKARNLEINVNSLAALRSLQKGNDL